MYEVLVEKKFSSAHFLRNYHGKDEPLHGHNWKVQVNYRGKQLKEPEQYLIDFAEVDRALDELLAKIDYKNLNEVPPFDKLNPSAENVAHWIYEGLSKIIPAHPPFSVTVWETEAGAASFYADQ